ncbi:MAG: DUF2147 domain-containing protein [Rhodospirillaceae bacterium]|nr:DUF2147 domain-containing protein [Rhodospirillaceae bacterium]
MLRHLSIITGVLALSAGAEAGQSDIVGHWSMPTSGMVIALAACNGAVCGEVIGLPDPAARDQFNPDPSLADRPLCRLQVLQVDEAEGFDGWQGRFYNPEDGTHYAVELLLNQDGRLQVWGQTGETMLTRIIPLAVVWSPVSPDREPCEVPPVS